MTPEIIGLVITTVGSIIVAFLQSRGRKQEAEITNLIIRGVEQGSAQLAADPNAGPKVVKHAIADLAKNSQFQQFLTDRVKALTNPEGEKK